jgi:hypothetical protein
MKTKTFEIGQRVKVYTGKRLPWKGYVEALGVPDIEIVWVSREKGGPADLEGPFHARQLVKLKKVKSVRVTRDKLRGVLLSKLVWTDFDSVCKELGL